MFRCSLGFCNIYVMSFCLCLSGVVALSSLLNNYLRKVESILERERTNALCQPLFNLTFNGWCNGSYQIIRDCFRHSLKRQSKVRYVQQVKHCNVQLPLQVPCSCPFPLVVSSKSTFLHAQKRSGVDKTLENIPVSSYFLVAQFEYADLRHNRCSLFPEAWIWCEHFYAPCFCFAI